MAGRCMMLIAGLLLLGSTVVQSASVRIKEPEGCTIETSDQTGKLHFLCYITATNINAVLYEMKEPQFSYINIGIHPMFSHFQFGDDAFHPNLQILGITGDMFSLSPHTFRGLSKLIVLALMKSLNADSTLYKNNVKFITEAVDMNTTTYPLNNNFTSQLFGEGWLEPLAKLQALTIFESNISSFPVEEFCTLKQLKLLYLYQNRINSTEGLGITCNSLSCIPCLPNVTHLNISHNPINELSVNISKNLPSLKVFDMSHCNLSILFIYPVTTESTEHFDASNNRLHSLLINEEDNCTRSYLHNLFLDNNQLHTISPGLLLCMPHLQQLNLSGNALTEDTLISAGLNNLTELTRLDLSHNNLKNSALLGNMTQLLEFWCTLCKMTTIGPDTFIHMRNLRYLILNNNNLSMIENGSLSHFSSLQRLDLSGNALNDITLTENLLSLTELDLSENLLSEIPDFPGSCWNLSTLIMDRNRITNIGPKQLSYLTNLNYLSLAFNHIEYITDYTFENQGMLKMLVLSSNKIKTISELGFYGLPSLTDLRLDNNFLMKLLPLKHLDKLMYLNLSRNMIKTTYHDYGLSLRGIDLSHNRISRIKSLFTNFKNLHYLQYVNYSYNHLSTLDKNTFMTSTLPRLKVYLQGNPLHVDCHSEWLLDTKLDKAYGQILDDQEKKDGRKRTILSNPVDKEDPYARIIENLIRNNRYVKIADWDLLQGTTATGESKSFPDLTRADFVCEYSELCYKPDCPQDCCNDFNSCPCAYFCYPDCTCYYSTSDDSIDFMNCSSRNMTVLPSRGSSYVTNISLDGNYLTSMNSSSLNFPYLTKLNAANSHISHLQPGAFNKLKMLRILHLQQNSIQKINKQTFILLINLEELYLQGNKIHQVDNGSFDDLVHLKVLWLHGNNLKILHFSLFERTYSLKELTLHDNPWSCDCQSGPAFKEWLTYSEIIVNRSRIYCDNKFPSNAGYTTGPASSGYNMTNYTVSFHYQAVIDLDCRVIETVHHHSKSITEVVSLAAAVAVLAIFILVIYKTRLLLRVWFYNKFGVRFHEEEDDNDDKPYDLFIAYAKVDERLVMYELLPKLEGGGMSYKVCLECRDWHPGTATTDAVVASVQLSKRTIVLVSANHLDTQWCEYSFDAAHYQVLKDKQIRLILVLTDLELEARMTRAMKLYMKTNTFLVMGEKWFWKKLRYYLADNPRGADYVVGREFRLMNAY